MILKQFLFTGPAHHHRQQHGPYILWSCKNNMLARKRTGIVEKPALCTCIPARLCHLRRSRRQMHQHHKRRPREPVQDIWNKSHPVHVNRRWAYERECGGWQLECGCSPAPCGFYTNPCFAAEVLSWISLQADEHRVRCGATHVCWPRCQDCRDVMMQTVNRWLRRVLENRASTTRRILAH